MSEPLDRPDPDALLRRVQEAETRKKRGKLKIFFGFAPGVGKTYRMLQVARDLVTEQKVDVAVGVVEGHKRRETAYLALGLDLLPRRKIVYRKHVLQEFDLDAALMRKPELLLVDELAHTNAPCSRHAKRWQDVEELLDAGIDVFTTMNVQHIESLNDAIAQITHVQVRETVPDSVLNGADAIELIDIAPEELLQRLKEGKVYLPDRARRAAKHLFQRGNLLALRELALSRTAQHVDEDLLESKPTHSRLRERMRGSLLDEIVRGSGDIDVHVINGDEGGERLPAPAQQRYAPPMHYVAAALLVGGTVATSLLLRVTLNLPDLEMLFLLTVMVTAVWFGRGPSIVAAALGVVSYNFFFVPPYYTLSMEDSRYFLTFAMMFGVGAAMSELAGRLRRQQRDAASREERTAALYQLTRELASTDTATHIAAIAARHAAASFNATAVVFGVDTEGGLKWLGAAPEGTQVGVKDLDVTKWTLEHQTIAGFGTGTLPGAPVLCAPLQAGQSRLGVIALALRDQGQLRADQRAFLDVFCRQTAAALERARLGDEAKHAELRAQTEEMRSSLLSAVSHDLRTPLGSITGAATSLRDDAELSASTQTELVESIVAEAERLERLVANLLDMTRLESGGFALKRDWVPLDEMVGSALTRLDARLEERKVTVSIAPDVPLVRVDPVLFEQVFVNLLENAVKYTPKKTAIEVVARREGERVEIGVRDHGSGLPKGAETRVFEKFFRGPHVGVSGAGLGLPICKGIVEAHGGMIRAESHPEGGATFHMSLPTGGTPPPLASPPLASQAGSS